MVSDRLDGERGKSGCDRFRSTQKVRVQDALDQGSGDKLVLQSVARKLATEKGR